MCAGRSATRTAGSTIWRNTSPAPSSWTSPPNSPDPRTPAAAATRSRPWSSSRRPPAPGASAAATSWWPMTTAETWPPPGSGGCCGTPVLPTSTCSTAAWPPGAARASPSKAANGRRRPGDVVLTDGAMPVIDAGQAASWGQQGLLLDARAGERYRGEFEPVDPRAGHIPGAVSAPTTGEPRCRRQVPVPGGAARALHWSRRARRCPHRRLLRLRRHGGPRNCGPGNRRIPRGPLSRVILRMVQ